MALPKIQVPTYDVKIPSTDQIVKIRPFLVKEEKILLMALQGEDSNEMSNAIKQIINNCVLTEDFDVEKLLIYDLEYLFLQLRIRSIGETTVIRFAPRNDVDCKECKSIREVEINLNDAEVVKNKNHTDTFKLTENITIKMKYPDFTILKEIENAKNKNDVEQLFKIFWHCVDCIYEGSGENAKQYVAKEIPINEGIEFIENLNNKQFNLIESFFETMPKLQQTIKVKCKSCDFEEEYTLVGLDSFFG